jgi:hypothetical protein
MNHLSIQHISTRKPYALEDEFLEPSPSPKPITTFGYELHPGIIAMVRVETFFRVENEDPTIICKSSRSYVRA